MDEIALSLKMKRLVRWLDDRCQPDNVVRRQYDGPPFGRCYLTIDPERQGEVASINLNRVYLCGTEAGLDADSPARLIELFTASGVRNFSSGSVPVLPWTRCAAGWRPAASGDSSCQYPTLVRTGVEPSHFKTDLEVREVRRAKSKLRATNSVKRCGRIIGGRRARTASLITWRSTASARSRSPRSPFLKASAT